ncbi:C1 family peptidase [Armatimonas rosea]|uniref:C1A family cysteine protease n=1 Tax=Armatimonas rosea TaxID=685828 RepID=A0A7W9SLZ5_ARMRO|nr:C1 family peptidase [Armatimonas rosea]MBB6048368.1 C1A family cysteine protease [Armatimonas rosea]
MAKQEVKPSERICNLIPSKDTETDWSIDSGLMAGALGAVAALPPSVDLRATWWKVGDQGSTGSCVGWATADGVMRYLLTNANKLKKTERLSPRFIWMASKETDQFTTRPESFIETAGTALKAAADICRKYGTVLEPRLPFTVSSNMYLGDEDTFYAEAAQRRAASYFNAQKDLDQWRQALASGKPILVGLSVDREWDTAAERAGKLDTFQPTTTRGGHAVCVVGYTADGRFILRNSWGTAWGDQGFAYASPAYIQEAFFPESYVLTV